MPSSRLATSASVAFRVDRHARWLLAGVDRGDDLGRVRLQVDHEHLVVGHVLPAGAIRLRVHRIGDQREVARGVDRQVDRRSDDRVVQRNGGGDPRCRRLRNIDNRYRVITGRVRHRLAVGAERDLLVIADDHQLGASVPDPRPITSTAAAIEWPANPSKRIFPSPVSCTVAGVRADADAIRSPRQGLPACAQNRSHFRAAATKEAASAGSSSRSATSAAAAASTLAT